jgi:hypothetical protein
MMTKEEKAAILAKVKPGRKPVQPSEIPALRLACLQAALAAVATHDGRMTGAYRDIEALIAADPEYQRQQAELRERERRARQDRPDTRSGYNGPYTGADAPRGNWTGD